MQFLLPRRALHAICTSGGKGEHDEQNLEWCQNYADVRERLRFRKRIRLRHWLGIWFWIGLGNKLQQRPDAGD